MHSRMDTQAHRRVQRHPRRPPGLPRGLAAPPASGGHAAASVGSLGSTDLGGTRPSRPPSLPGLVPQHGWLGGSVLGPHLSSPTPPATRVLGPPHPTPPCRTGSHARPAACLSSSAAARALPPPLPAPCDSRGRHATSSPTAGSCPDTHTCPDLTPADGRPGNQASPTLGCHSGAWGRDPGKSHSGRGPQPLTAGSPTQRPQGPMGTGPGAQSHPPPPTVTQPRGQHAGDPPEPGPATISPT